MIANPLDWFGLNAAPLRIEAFNKAELFYVVVRIYLVLYARSEPVNAKRGSILL